jgi:hypothetical protein
VAIPALNDDGYLPEGIHECAFDELVAHFGRFSSTDTRIRLCEKLAQLFQELRSTKLIRAVFVDGSFVTSKINPGDIDLIIVLPADFDESAELKPFQYNCISRKRVRTRFSFDVIVVIEDSLEFKNAIQFFSQVKNKMNTQQGILRINL